MAHQALLWKLSIFETSTGIHRSEGYLFGTMHSASSMATNKMTQICEYLSPCTHYYAETNLDSSLFSTGFKPVTPAAWRGLSDLINPPAYIKAQRIIYYKCGLDLNDIQHLPPLMLTALLSERMLHLEHHLQPLDIQLWNKAKNAGLVLGGIESPEEQAFIYQKIPMEYQLKELKSMITHITRSSHRLNRLSNAYNNEDLKKLMHLSGSSLGGARRILLYDRNKRMAERLFQLLQVKANRSFISIGAAHLPGVKGILGYLNRMGVSLVPISLKTLV